MCKYIDCNKLETLSSSTNNFDFNSLFAALIGGAFALLGVLVAEYLTRKRSKDEEKDKTINFLKNVKTELNTLWDMYLINMGNIIEEHDENQPFYYTYIVNQEYFTIYTNNSSYIGLIKNDKLRESIIRSYAKGKALIDTYQLNNKMLEQHELYAAQQDNLMTHDYRKILKEYAPKIKSLHFELKSEIETLNKLLEKEIKND